ncbi:MAG: response regulator transcription factor [Deltaproteobacteria bacterium]|nr:response regulator transcription factor [Deltaproteobacteria bacterium]
MNSANNTFITVVLVDDHAVVRDGLTAIIASQDDMKVVATAATARAGLEAVALHRPQIALMDLRLPQMDGLTAVQVLREKFPDVLVLMLSSADGDKAIEASLAAGARGYVLKSAPASELLAAIRAVAHGQRFLSPAAATALASRALSPDLTLREVEVLEAVSEGQSNADIAASLGVAEKTVKNHLSNVFAKLGATDRTHAVTIALQRGIIELPERRK